MKIPTTIFTAGLIAALVLPAAAAAAEAKTIPVTYPATQVKVTKTSPAKRAVPHVTKREVEPRQPCICVTFQIDRAKVQAQANFGMATLLAGTGTIDQILSAIEASW